MKLDNEIEDAGHFIHDTKVIRVKSVKEFIKEMKGKFLEIDDNYDREWIRDECNKLAGDKLII